MGTEKRYSAIEDLIAPADEQPDVRMSAEPIIPSYRPLVPTPLSDFQSAALSKDAPDLGETVRLALEYNARVFNAGFVPETLDYAQEAVERLQQLNFLLQSVYVQQEVFTTFLEWAPHEVDTGSVTNPDALYNHEHARFLVNSYTETFYYLAHRLHTVLKNGHNLLPFITGFSQAVGVRTVRNQLIEHPEGSNSRITDRRWVYSSQAGPQVKAARRPDQPRHAQDPGLYLNAAELKDKVDRVFKRALETWDDGLVRQTRIKFNRLKERIAAQDYDIELSAYSLLAYLVVSPRFAELAVHVESLGATVGPAGWDPQDLKIAKRANVSSLAEIDDVLGISSPWCRSFLRDYFGNSGQGGYTDRGGIFRLILIASLPTVFTDEVLREELGFSQPERITALVRSYQTHKLEQERAPNSSMEGGGQKGEGPSK